MKFFSKIAFVLFLLGGLSIYFTQDVVNEVSAVSFAFSIIALPLLPFSVFGLVGFLYDLGLYFNFISEEETK